MLKSSAKIAVGSVIALVFVSLSAFAWLKLAPRRAPEGQPALETLRAESLSRFRDAFNDHDGEVRIIAMLSPT